MDPPRSRRAQRLDRAARHHHDVLGVLPIINFYDIQLSFDRVKDLALRKRLNELPTNFHLPARDIELLKAAAKDLLQQSEQFQKLMNGLQ